MKRFFCVRSSMIPTGPGIAPESTRTGWRSAATPRAELLRPRVRPGATGAHAMERYRELLGAAFAELGRGLGELDGEHQPRRH